MSFLKNKVDIDGVGYDVLISPLVAFDTIEEASSYLMNSDLSKLTKEYDNDFKVMLDWATAVQDNLGKSNCRITCNNFRLTETRKGQYLLSSDFSLDFSSDKTYQAKDIKDIIQVHGIRYSRGYRYWFLFEMSQNFMQLYMFPYYKYGNS